MSDAEIPSRFGPAIKWAIAVIFLFVFALGISESAHAGELVATGIYSGLFIITFVIAVKWKAISDAVIRWRKQMAIWSLIALGAFGMLAVGIATGGLISRANQFGLPTETTGRITWNFDQPGESYFLAMTRLNDQEIRIVGFQAHGKNTSTDPISEFNGFIRSDRTNEQRPIYISAQESTPDPNRPAFVIPPGIPTAPDETFGIPGLADFDITTHDKPFIESGKDGVPYSQFIRDFGGFTVVLNYDNKRLERHFSLEKIKSEVARFEKQSHGPDTTAPRVTRKPGAKPVQMFPILIPPELPLQQPPKD